MAESKQKTQHKKFYMITDKQCTLGSEMSLRTEVRHVQENHKKTITPLINKRFSFTFALNGLQTNEGRQNK